MKNAHIKNALDLKHKECLESYRTWSFIAGSSFLGFLYGVYKSELASLKLASVILILVLLFSVYQLKKLKEEMGKTRQDISKLPA